MYARCNVSLTLFPLPQFLLVERSLSVTQIPSLCLGSDWLPFLVLCLLEFVSLLLSVPFCQQQGILALLSQLGQWKEYELVSKFGTDSKFSCSHCHLFESTLATFIFFSNLQFIEFFLLNMNFKFIKQ